MAARPRALTERDEAEWASFAHRIVPLPGRPAVRPPDGEPPEPAALVAPRSVTAPAPTVRAAPLGIGGHPPGVDTGTWQRFHRGQLHSVRKLDLHGMTAQHAFHALRTFLRAAHAEHVRCVEVVTGRGN